MVLLRLIESRCVPILNYAVEVIHVVDRHESRSLRVGVAYNAIFRKLFHYRVFESVTNVQHALQRHTWEELTDKRREGFLRRARLCNPNSLVRAFC